MAYSYWQVFECGLSNSAFDSFEAGVNSKENIFVLRDTVSQTHIAGC